MIVLTFNYMVEYTGSLDSIFGSLADPTRRDILRRVAACELSVGEIAAHYNLTFAAVSKHIKVLEKANLISKRRKGKEQIVHLSPYALQDANEYLDWYKQLWGQRFDSLESYLIKGEQ